MSEVRIITSNCGKIIPHSIEDYRENGGFSGLEKAVKMKPAEIIAEVKKSNLLGRGGAGFPTGIKWEQMLEVNKSPKYIVCNADEGEPGTFKDKLLLEKDPLRIIEGMIIAALAVNSQKGYIYLRDEYSYLYEIIKKAIDNSICSGYLGHNILGSGLNFEIEIVTGAGAYICGENSALLESIEGKSGRPRMKPPHLKDIGLFNMPTLINNVETFACISYIIVNGGEKYKSFGTEYSGGTKLVCLSGSINNKGVFEVPFGTSLRDIIYGIGGGIPDGRKLKLLQIGGSSGPCIPDSMLDIPLCYRKLKSAGLTLGSGSLLAIDDSTSIIDFLKYITEFFMHESCGKCTPCRIGNFQIYKILDKFSSGLADPSDIETLKILCTTMKNASFCGLGEAAPTALSTCLKYFRGDFEC